MSYTGTLDRPCGVIRHGHEGDRIAVLGCEVAVRLHAHETGGLALLEVRVPPGAGVPLHLHSHEDETFLVTEGEVVFTLAGAAPIAVRPGGVVHGPSGLAHGFQNASAEPACLTVAISPGEGIERMFQDLAALPAGAGGPEIAAVCGGYGVSFV